MTSVMQSKRQGNQPAECADGSKIMDKTITYPALTGMGKNMFTRLGTGCVNVLALLVTWLYRLVVRNIGDAKSCKADDGAKASKRLKKSDSLPDIATKSPQADEEEYQDETRLAECPLTPVIAHQETTLVSRRTSTPEISHLSIQNSSPKVKKANTFVMVEYRDGSDTVGFNEKKLTHNTPAAIDTSTTISTDSIKSSLYAEASGDQQYVVVEVPRDDTALIKKKKKKKRSKAKREETAKSPHSASCDTKGKNTSISAPLSAHVAAVHYKNTPDSNATTTEDDSEVLNSSNNSRTIRISDDILTSRNSIDIGATLMGEQQESELEKAWKTASLAAAKLGLDSFGEDTSLTRELSYPIASSERMNSSNLSNLSWGTSIESSLSFGSPLHSTSDKKSSSFKNIKDIWDKTA